MIEHLLSGRQPEITVQMLEEQMAIYETMFFQAQDRLDELLRMSL